MILTRVACIEGIDGSGKTTVAKELVHHLSLTSGNLWSYDHCPTFTSEQADILNFGNVLPWQREFVFIIDTYEHQRSLNSGMAKILDRYIMSGLAYALIFSPETYKGLVQIYGISTMFNMPSLTLFLDVDPSTARSLICEREQKDDETIPSIDILSRLRDSYYQQIPVLDSWGSKVQIIKPIIGDVGETVRILAKAIEESAAMDTDCIHPNWNDDWGKPKNV